MEGFRSVPWTLGFLGSVALSMGLLEIASRSIPMGTAYAVWGGIGAIGTVMIGILFFLFEFFDDQLLAFMVMTLVWLCELFKMISVRTRVSMQYFPRFFFLYFIIFHIYFFSYSYGERGT